MNISPETYAFFKAAGVFRVKTAEKARERFDDALGDYLDTNPDNDVDDGGNAFFDALMAEEASRKAAKIAADAERERKRAAKEAADVAKPVTGGTNSATDHIERRGHGSYVLTVAQNNTDVDASFLASLEVYCKQMGAELLIARTTYNKGGFRQPGVNDTEGSDGAIYFATEVKPHLVEGQIDLAGVFHFIADANVIVTAKNPLSGFDGITPTGVGAIIPASKIGLKVSAALKGAKPKILASTGAVTKRNYILRKAGAVAAIEHNIGAVFIDTVAGEMRHLEQMEGARGFYDLDGFYSPDGFTPLANGDVAAIQPGDIHAEKMEQVNLDTICDMIADFHPERVILHDVLDFSSRNHHNIKDPFFLGAMLKKNATVRGDLETVTRVIDAIGNAGRSYRAIVDIIESNHDLAADTWLRSTDWKADPINADTYLELALAKLRGGSSFNTLAYAYQMSGGTLGERITFHKTDDSVMVAGVEMGNHGHNGINGSRGSPMQFRSLGVAMNTGHTHSPGINGRVYTAGVTASLDMDYNKGASGWAIAHVFTYRNGQRQIIFA